MRLLSRLEEETGTELLSRADRTAPSPCKFSFLEFLYQCAWTIDQSAAGEVRKWPRGPGWDDYWLDWEYALLHCSPLLVDKTRRTMASNIVCYFDLWLAAGGQDPRWPSLLRGDKNRLIIIQGKKMEGQTGAEEFVERIGKFCRLFEQQGCRRHWQDFPQAAVSTERIRFSNGSHVEAVPQGASQIRGPGATLIHMEELGDMDQAEQSIGSALPALSGMGHLVGVTTPNPAAYVARIRAGKIKAARGLWKHS